MANVNTNEEWARRRMVKQVAAYLEGHGPDCELENLAIFAAYCGIPKQLIRDYWASAREELAKQKASEAS